MQSVVDDLVSRIERVEEHLHPLDDARPADAEVTGHILFLSTAAGYLIVERDGPPPSAGEEIVVDGRTYRAERRRPSPFPADPRPCVIVQAVQARA